MSLAAGRPWAAASRPRMRVAEVLVARRVTVVMTRSRRGAGVPAAAGRSGELELPAGHDEGRVGENLPAGHLVPEVQPDQRRIAVTGAEVVLRDGPQAVAGPDDDRPPRVCLLRGLCLRYIVHGDFRGLDQCVEGDRLPPGRPDPGSLSRGRPGDGGLA